MELAILNKMVKIGFFRRVTFEPGVKVLGHVIAEGKMFQARGTDSAKVLRQEHAWYA